MNFYLTTAGIWSLSTVLRHLFDTWSIFRKRRIRQGWFWVESLSCLLWPNPSCCWHTPLPDLYMYTEIKLKLIRRTHLGLCNGWYILQTQHLYIWNLHGNMTMKDVIKGMVKNIARVRNCPDVTISNSLFLVFIFLFFCLFVFLSFCLVVLLSFCLIV